VIDCVYLGNCVEMIDVYLACIKSGIIFVPINILYRDREISHILRDAEPRPSSLTSRYRLRSGLDAHGFASRHTE
jgi:acyl-CoA synthetase (AMP-forming)/AMP-acid ligase II